MFIQLYHWGLTWLSVQVPFWMLAIHFLDAGKKIMFLAMFFVQLLQLHCWSFTINVAGFVLTKNFFYLFICSSLTVHCLVGLRRTEASVVDVGNFSSCWRNFKYFEAKELWLIRGNVASSSWVIGSWSDSCENANFRASFLQAIDWYLSFIRLFSILQTCKNPRQHFIKRNKPSKRKLFSNSFHKAYNQFEPKRFASVLHALPFCLHHHSPYHPIEFQSTIVAIICPAFYTSTRLRFISMTFSLLLLLFIDTVPWRFNTTKHSPLFCHYFSLFSNL